MSSVAEGDLAFEPLPFRMTSLLSEGLFVRRLAQSMVLLQGLSVTSAPVLPAHLGSPSLPLPQSVQR